MATSATAITVRVLFIHNRYQQSGGEDIVAESQINLLREKGHDVQSLFFSNDVIKGFTRKIIIALRAFYNGLSASRLSKAIADFKPDIIHVHNIFFVASPSVLMVAARHKIPVAYTLHNYRLLCANALLLRNNEPCELCIQKKITFLGFRHKCYRNSRLESLLVTAITGIHKYLNTWQGRQTGFISLTEYARDKFINSSLALSPDRIFPLPNFTPDPGTNAIPREDFFVYTGRITKEKGTHVLLKAFSEMPTKKILIIGIGPEKKKLMTEYKSFDNIFFIDYQNNSDIICYLRKCRAFICPSIWNEGAPLTVIEALATGTPVIASQLEPIKETIKNGYNGYLFKTADSHDLKEKVLLMAEDTNANALMYQNARETYLEKFHPEVHYQSLISLYKKLININNRKNWS